MGAVHVREVPIDYSTDGTTVLGDLAQDANPQRAAASNHPNVGCSKVIRMTARV
jgi:hypothetical protein